MPTTPALGLAVLTICMMSGGVVAAETIRDEATGLSLSAPDGYAIERGELPPAVHAAARFSVQRPADPASTGCTVDAQILPPVDATTQGLVRLLRKREGETAAWRDKALLQIMSSVSVQSNRAYSEGGMEALQVDGWPRQGNASSTSQIDRTKQVRIVVLKTDQGYVNITCRANAEAFPARIAEFEQLVRSVRMAR